MKLEDLESLKLAISTGNINYFHGDMSDAFVEVVDELYDLKAKEEEQLEYKELYEEVKITVQETMELKTHIMEEYEGRKQVTVSEMEERFEEVLDVLGSVI